MSDIEYSVITNDIIKSFDCTCMLMHRHSGCIIHELATRMYFKNIWAELSYEYGPSCLMNLGRVVL